MASFVFGSPDKESKFLRRRGPILGRAEPPSASLWFRSLQGQRLSPWYVTYAWIQVCSILGGEESSLGVLPSPTWKSWTATLPTRCPDPTSNETWRSWFCEAILFAWLSHSDVCNQRGRSIHRGICSNSLALLCFSFTLGPPFRGQEFRNLQMDPWARSQRHMWARLGRIYASSYSVMEGLWYWGRRFVGWCPDTCP